MITRKKINKRSQKYENKRNINKLNTEKQINIERNTNTVKICSRGFAGTSHYRIHNILLKSKRFRTKGHICCKRGFHIITIWSRWKTVYSVEETNNSLLEIISIANVAKMKDCPFVRICRISRRLSAPLRETQNDSPSPIWRR